MNLASPPRPFHLVRGSREDTIFLPARFRAVERRCLTALEREIPSEGQADIVWLVLDQAAEDASQVLGSGHRLIKLLKEAIKSRDFAAYLNLGTVFGSPTMYGDSRSYLAATTVLSLFKKVTFLKANGIDPMAKAISRFELAEKYCRITNRRLSYFRKSDFSDSRPLPKRLRLHEVFHLARRKISDWLGPVEAIDFDSGARFGPGGTLSLNRPFSQAYFKLPRQGRSMDTVTSGAYFRAARSFIRSEHLIQEGLATLGYKDTGSFDSDPTVLAHYKLFDRITKVAEYNKVTFVPKNAKTHRSIAIEPDWNIQFQLAVGEYLKRKLASHGCNLKDQTRNQLLALEGSTDDGPHGPVTIDLEMASDTLSVELVRELLPPEWFELLDGLRTRVGSFKGSVRGWEKFSSMGNGFTFELESLVFYSLAQACSDLSGETEYFADTFGFANRYGFVSVFGDDIIVPKACSSHLVQVLRFCGFRTNGEKTFLDGPFRESCGSDFWHGVAVRPRFYDGPLTRQLDLVQLRNVCFANSLMSPEFSVTADLVLILLDEVLVRNLRTPHWTLGFDALYFPVDECHCSFLVNYDRRYQCFVFPSVSLGTINWRSRQDRLYRAQLYHLSKRGDEACSSTEAVRNVKLPSSGLKMSYRTI